MFCKKCGKEIEDTWVKCPYCGARVTKEKETKENGRKDESQIQPIKEMENVNVPQNNPDSFNSTNGKERKNGGGFVRFAKKLIKIFFVLLLIIGPFTGTEFGTTKDYILEVIKYYVSLLLIAGPVIALVCNIRDIRDKLPLFKKHKLSSTILAGFIVYLLIGIVGMGAYGVIDTFHTEQYYEEYKADQEAKLAEAKAKKAAEEKAKEEQEKKAAEEKAKEEQEKKEAEEKAKEEQEKKEAEEKAKEEQEKKEAEEKAKEEQEKKEAEEKAKEEQENEYDFVLPMNPDGVTSYDMIANEILIKQRDRIEAFNEERTVSENIIMQIVNGGKELEEAGLIIGWRVTQDEWIDMARTPSSLDGKMFMTLVGDEVQGTSWNYNSEYNSFTVSDLVDVDGFYFWGNVADVMDVNGKHIENPSYYPYALVIGQIYMGQSGDLELDNVVAIFADKDEIDILN